MHEIATTVIGIDVGGECKGFHAVALQNGTFVATLAHSDPAVIVSWCRRLKAVVVLVEVLAVVVLVVALAALVEVALVEVVLAEAGNK